ncbi:MAG TPA: alpha/beta hydrolase, partial [Prolixibacteraceae bacterium]|nr:alpha/beta hydrolase [Prolixibacteraceae bacterium]
MNNKAFFLIAVALILVIESEAHIQKNMIAEQIKIRNNQVEINYFEQGQGDITLLLLHGWCIDGTYWANQLEAFSKTYKVIAIDLPGFGKSKA